MFEQNQIVQYPATLLGAKKFKGDIDGNKIDSCTVLVATQMPSQTGNAVGFTVAVMGCVVNGPGEAREADLGIAGGKGKGLLFRKGEPLYPVTGGREELLEALMREVALLLEEKRS